MSRAVRLGCWGVLALLFGLAWPSLGAAHALAPVVVRVLDSSSTSLSLSVRYPTPEQARAGFEVVGCDVAEANRALKSSLAWAGNLSCGGPAQDAGRFRINFRTGLPTGLMLEDLRQLPGTLQLSPELGPGEGITLEATPTAPKLAPYLAQGVRHVWSGADHLGFVACLLLVCGPLALGRSMRRLGVVVTLFSVAHSLSLGFAVLGGYDLGSPGLEASIALSVVFAAREGLCALRAGSLEPGRNSLRRLYLAVVCFGLLHGLGFASGVVELGLPPDQVPLALLLFNLGVELGQVAFAAALAALLSLVPRLPRQLLSYGVAYAAGAAGVYWLTERVGLLG